MEPGSLSVLVCKKAGTAGAAVTGLQSSQAGLRGESGRPSGKLAQLINIQRGERVKLESLAKRTVVSGKRFCAELAAKLTPQYNSLSLATITRQAPN